MVRAKAVVRSLPTPLIALSQSMLPNAVSQRVESLDDLTTVGGLWASEIGVSVAPFAKEFEGIIAHQPVTHENLLDGDWLRR